MWNKIFFWMKYYTAPSRCNKFQKILCKKYIILDVFLSYEVKLQTSPKIVHGINLGFFHRLIIYVLSLEMQLSRRKDWDSINRLSSATFLCLSQARTCISNVRCYGRCCVHWVKVIGDCFVAVGGIVDHHCLNFLFII
jgi:hypothetical protein